MTALLHTKWEMANGIVLLYLLGVNRAQTGLLQTNTIFMCYVYSLDKEKCNLNILEWVFKFQFEYGCTKY